MSADGRDVVGAVGATDAFDARRARHAPPLLREFNQAGVLAPADVHVARRLCALAKETDELVVLAGALAVRGPRLGHVCVDLAAIRELAVVDAEEDVDLDALPWPQWAPWRARLAASPLIADGEDGPSRPLRLVGSVLYLDRYWREERRLAELLRERSRAMERDVDEERLADGLERLFPGQTGEPQGQAAAAAVRRRLAVIAGGPGTGKTTTVARIVALLLEQGIDPSLVALAAPTGRAAARLQEAVNAQADALAVAEPVREALRALGAGTLHRLLGWRPDSHSRFRHDASTRLPHDVVIVDETSMVSLSLMTRLLEAVRPQARLILLGDPGQLTSIEAGAVLGDIVAPAPAGVVVLDRVHRFGGAIARLARAVREGDGEDALRALAEAPDEEVRWIDLSGGDSDGALAPIREPTVAAARSMTRAAREGDPRAALEALASVRVLCAHRRGPHGVSAWTARIERWLAGEIEGFAAGGRWYPGRPLLVTANDHGLRLYNGDTGVIVVGEAGRPLAAFARAEQLVRVSPARLQDVETVYAMTVHKSQGSQFATTVVVLPEPGSRILTRELLYTAITRARRRLILAGTEEALLAAISRPIARASGLRERLAGF
ncbi:MAG TPA: exodeoxyribonuclease V subunit alpha [Solirubrobacteraceae bacterium]|nr:exodeoxyribonuclease V subunit alpha [Solirubrobacteraceae bacterium]